ncbi:MAG: hypothetical protein PHE56_01225 [Bacteroidales bacterium]|nr:hypothetical protein [Bacteroidales bacterium]
MKKLILILTAMFLFAGVLFSQNSIQISDIAVSPVMLTDTVTGLPLEDDAEILSVMFKINDISLAETVHILIGTAQSTGDVLSIVANVYSEDGDYFISYGGNSYIVNDNVVEAVVSLSENDYQNFAYITAFVTDNASEETEHLVFTK